MGFGNDTALGDLHRRMMRCKACPLHQVRSLAVPGEGPCNASRMLVGEAPGKQEDLTGRPFCGRSGRFLDGLLERAGLERGELFITSAVKCRPPHNRNPRRLEAETCRQKWLDAQIALIDPRIVVVMGRVAAETVLGETGPLRDLRGRTMTRYGRVFMVTYHPAAAMRFSESAEGLLEDLRSLAEPADGVNPP